MKEPKPSDPKRDDSIETARRIMKRLTEMPHRDHADSKVGQAKGAPKAPQKKVAKSGNS
jgi:hypothetical protein